MTCFIPRPSAGSPMPKRSNDSQVSVSIPSPDQVKLTHFASGLGCACKIKAELLETLIPPVHPQHKDSNLLVGTESGDDASVFKIDDNTAIINTTDFFPPIVDDAEIYGKIAAVNALSDVYAMGGKPLTALSLVGFPTSKLPLETLKRIMKGASDKAAEAGIMIGGGHTIDTSEPIFGLAVTGIVHPSRFIRNVGVQKGDYLILTKPIGTGVVTSALKRGEGVCPPHTATAAMESMMMLNKAVCETLMADDSIRTKVAAMTDVTGFGLAGHLKKMLRTADGSQNPLVATLYSDQIPVLPEVVKLLQQRDLSIYSTSSFNNVSFAAPFTLFTQAVSKQNRLLFFDAQTSGGLLIAFRGSAAELASAVQKMKASLPEGMLRDAVRAIGRITTEESLGITNLSKWISQRTGPAACEGTILMAESEQEAAGLAAPQKEAIALEQLQQTVVLRNEQSPLPHITSVAPSIAPSPSSASPSSTPTPTASSSSSPLPVESVSVSRPPPTLDMSLVWFYKNSVITLGDDALGKLLAKGMLQKALELPQLPHIMIFMGDSVEMTTIVNETVATLQEMERLGVTILSCITCLNALTLKDRLRVGRSATAPEIVAILGDSSKSIVSMS